MGNSSTEEVYVVAILLLIMVNCEPETRGIEMFLLMNVYYISEFYNLHIYILSGFCN